MTRDTGQRADTASKVDPASGEHAQNGKSPGAKPDADSDADSVHLVSPVPTPPSTWQPIETGPTDGTVVLLYAPSKWDPRGDVFAGCWTMGEGLKFCGVADESYPWLAFDPGTDGLNAYMADRVTHWMPLPTAPSDGGAVEAASAPAGSHKHDSAASRIEQLEALLRDARETVAAAHDLSLDEHNHISRSLLLGVIAAIDSHLEPVKGEQP